MQFLQVQEPKSIYNFSGRVLPHTQSRNYAMRARRPRNHLSGPPKNFFLDGDTKERAPKGQCQAGGLGACPPKNFAEFDFILEAFCAF